MSWRVVVVSSNAKVDYKLEYLVVRTVDEVKRVHLMPPPAAATQV